MSMAGRPTWVGARGGNEQGGYRRHNPSMQFSSRDLASHTKLKVRQTGQNTSDEVTKRDLKRELEEREKKGKKDKPEDKKKEDEKPLAIKEKGEEDDDERRAREKREKTYNIDADDSDSSSSSGSDSDSDAPSRKRKGKQPAASKKGKGSGSDSNSDSDSDSDSDSEDETDELMKELERIKKEREQDRIKQERQNAEDEARRRDEAFIHGNPLVNQDDDYSMKRKWYDDVVFKNQSRDEPTQKKRFINDTTRNDFARKFLTKYIK